MTDDKSKPKLDIFDLLKHIDKGDFGFYKNLSPEVKKTFAPVVVTRWLSGSINTNLRLLNSTLNTLVFSLGKHPDLLYKLMIVSAYDGTVKRYRWLKRDAKKVKVTEKIAIIKKFYDCSAREAQLYIDTLSNDDIKELADSLGVEFEPI